jgi:hypothetical protein
VVEERDYRGARGKPLGNQIDAPELDAVTLRDLELVAIPLAVLLLSPEIHDGLDPVTTDALLELFRRKLAAPVRAAGNDDAEIVAETRAPESENPESAEAE